MTIKESKGFVKDIPVPDDRPRGPSGHPLPGFRTIDEQLAIDSESRSATTRYPKGYFDGKQKHVSQKSNGC